MRTAPLPGVWVLASALAFTLHFLAMPRLDLYANGLFYRAGEGFLLLGNPFFNWLHKDLGWFVGAVLGACALVWILSRFGARPESWRLRRPAALHLVLVMLLGPGLLVNGVFKDHWGRARPVHVQEFGGEARFTPAWIMSDQCGKNCSFVCGDASVGFALLAPAFFSRRRRFWLATGLAAGGALGLMRMAQGGHFFSDVVFSFYVVYFAAWVVWRWMVRRASAPA
jgi:lipid A 4'-phosphatase